MLLGKGCHQTCSMQGCHKLSVCKKTQYLKNEVCLYLENSAKGKEELKISHKLVLCVKPLLRFQCWNLTIFIKWLQVNIHAWLVGWALGFLSPLIRRELKQTNKKKSEGEICPRPQLLLSYLPALLEQEFPLTALENRQASPLFPACAPRPSGPVLSAGAPGALWEGWLGGGPSRELPRLGPGPAALLTRSWF